MADEPESLAPADGLLEIFGVPSVYDVPPRSALAGAVSWQGARSEQGQPLALTRPDAPSQGDASYTNPFPDYHAQDSLGPPKDVDLPADASIDDLFDDAHPISLSDLAQAPHSTAHLAPPARMATAARLLLVNGPSPSSPKPQRRPSQPYLSASHLAPAPKETAAEKSRRKRKKRQIGWDDSQSGEASSSTEDEPDRSKSNAAGSSDMVLCTSAVEGQINEGTSETEEPTQQAPIDTLPPLAESSRRGTTVEGEQRAIGGQGERNGSPTTGNVLSFTGTQAIFDQVDLAAQSRLSSPIPAALLPALHEPSGSNSTHIPDSEPSIGERSAPEDEASLLPKISQKDATPPPPAPPAQEEAEESLAVPLARLKPPVPVPKPGRKAKPKPQILQPASDEEVTQSVLRVLPFSTAPPDAETSEEEDASNQPETNYEDVPEPPPKPTRVDKLRQPNSNSNAPKRDVAILSPKSKRTRRTGRVSASKGFYKDLADGKTAPTKEPSPAPSTSKTTLPNRSAKRKAIIESSEGEEDWPGGSVEISPRKKKARLAYKAPGKKDVKGKVKQKEEELELDELESGRGPEEEAGSDEDEAMLDQIVRPTCESERMLCGMLSHPEAPDLPIQRVFVLWPDENGFFPAEVLSVSKGRAHVAFDDLSSATVWYKDLRYAILRDGDPVVYTGDEASSQDDSGIHDLCRVYRVEWADKSGRRVPEDIALGSRMILAVSKDKDPSQKFRFKVEGIKVPTKPKEFAKVLDDRKLTQETLAAFKAAEKALKMVRHRSRVDSFGSDTRSATSAISKPNSPVSARSPTTIRRSNPTGIFQNVGFLLTGYAKTDVPERDPIPLPKGHARNSHQAVIAERILQHGGHIIDEVERLFDFDLGPDGKTTTRFLSKHASLGYIICLADRPQPKSAKYMLSLALGLPCISTRWIDVSFEQNALQPLGPFMLGSGFSLDLGWYSFGTQTKLMMPDLQYRLEDVEARAPAMQLFSGHNFLLVHPRKESTLMLKRLCAALGAHRIEVATSSDTSTSLKAKCDRADRILMEDNKEVPDGIPKNKQNVLVDLKYLKECLAAGRVLSPRLYAD